MFNTPQNITTKSFFIHIMFAGSVGSFSYVLMSEQFYSGISQFLKTFMCLLHSKTVLCPVLWSLLNERMHNLGLNFLEYTYVLHESREVQYLSIAILPDFTCVLLQYSSSITLR